MIQYFSLSLDCLFFVRLFEHHTDFKEERRMLLEVVGPELQTLYDDRQIEIEFVDMHFGTGPDAAIVDLNPHLLDDHLSEIDVCHRYSKSVFCIVSIYSISPVSHFFCHIRNSN